MAELISVIVTTYNREDALDAVLRSLAHQSDPDFEVIIADDGSGPATAKLIDAWKTIIARRVEHVWHTDQGFRAAEIRNRAILAARGAYCIFLDGDCIVRGDFVAAHRRLAEPGWFVTGNRILLSSELTTRVLREKLTPEIWDLARWLVERWRGGINRLSALLYLPFGPLRRMRQKAWRGARSCNLAIWRADLDRVDGFDADYSGWGKEDLTLSCVCYVPVCAVRMAYSRLASFIFGMQRPTVRSCPKTNANWARSLSVIASARSAACRLFRTPRQPPWSRAEQWPEV